jgi:hypothetical protein
MIKSVGIREFRDRTSHYLGSQEVVAVKRHNQIIGFYIPAQPSEQGEILTALSQLEQSLAQLYRESGLDEDSFAQALDLSKRNTDAPSR